MFIVAVIVGALAFGVLTYLLQQRRQRKIFPPIDLTAQSVESPNESGTRLNRMVADGSLMEYLYKDVRTIYQAFLKGASLTESGDCLGYRKEHSDGTKPYHWISYNEAIKRSTDIAAGMLSEGIQPGQHNFIGLYSQNRPEWCLAEQACHYYSMVPVPLYDTLGPDSCTHIIATTEAQLVFCDTLEKARKLINLKKQCPSLKMVVVFQNPLSESEFNDIVRTGIRVEVAVHKLSDLERIGHEVPESERVPPMPPNPDDLATVCFTSGTTGAPKGVMLTHRNIISDMTLVTQLENFPISSNDTLISFLPLAHIFERISEYILFIVGGRVGYFAGDIRFLVEDMMELRPTILPVVPRILNRMYDRSMQEANKNLLSRFLMEVAVKQKTKDLQRMVISTDSIWDKLIFDKIRARTGGQVKLMVTGSAPISSKVLTFIRCAMGCSVLEAYGQTECCGGATMGTEGDPTAGHVGPPVVSVEIKLADVPEMDYLANNRQGEILIRGPSVFKGYYKEEEKTREALDEDGWFHTDDIGEWTETGCLRIIDRKKNIFKLAQGEFVAPETIESVYLRSQYVSQVFVDGRSLKASLLGIVVPDPEVLPEGAQRELGVSGMSFAELCREEQVKKMILEDMTRVGVEAGLMSYQQVKDIYVEAEMFTVEHGLLTPTMKSIRSSLRKYYEIQIEHMYENLP